MPWILKENVFSHSLPQKCDFLEVCKIMTALIEKPQPTNQPSANDNLL